MYHLRKSQIYFFIYLFLYISWVLFVRLSLWLGLERTKRPWFPSLFQDEHFFKSIFASLLDSNQLIKVYKGPLEKTFGLVSVQSCERNPVCNSPPAVLMFGHQRADCALVQHLSMASGAAAASGKGAIALWSLVIFRPIGASTSSEV